MREQFNHLRFPFPSPALKTCSTQLKICSSNFFLSNAISLEIIENPTSDHHSWEMDNVFEKGKFFSVFIMYLVTFLVIYSSSGSDAVVVSSSGVEDVVVEGRNGNSLIMDRYYDQIKKLEQLVMNLSEIVSRLESKMEPLVEKFKTKEEAVQDRDRVGGVSKSNGVVTEEEKERKGFSVKKYNPFWSERFQFMSAVKLNSGATCVNVLPFDDYEGLSKYFAVGDDQGKVYVFLRNGDVLAEFSTLSSSPVTAMLSYMSLYKNESVLVTGHKNGAILMHRVFEALNGEDWSFVAIESIGESGVSGSDKNKDGSAAITTLEVHHVGRTRYTLSADASGRIRVVGEYGLVYGSVKPASKPLVFLKQRLLFLTERGAGSLDLRSMSVRESECDGLNRSLAKNYVFDASDRTRAYGFTSEGELVHVFFMGDLMNFKCRVRSKKKFEMDEPIALQAIKGYLLAITLEKVFVYNVSSKHYGRAGAPRLLFFVGIDEIRLSFLNNQDTDKDLLKTEMVPLVASDHEKLVVVGLGDGYVGMYQSNLPVFKVESSSILWTSPVLFFILFLFGAWHFFAKKKEVLTSWGPDDPFASATAAPSAPSASASDDRAFADSSSRNADLMEVRGTSVLRASSRRYVSPSRYSAGTSNSFRPNPTDHNTRPAAVDPNFRTSELKYRRSTLEAPPGFPQRREGSLFANSQALDEGN